MSPIPIPGSLTLEEIQLAFRAVQVAIAALPGASTASVDLHGTRITNAGEGVAAGDYVTKAQLDARVTAPKSGVPPLVPGVTTAAPAGTVRGRVIFLGEVDFPNFTDGTAHHCILFVNSQGAVSVDEGHLAYNDVLNFLEIGFGTKIKWFHQTTLGSPSDGLLQALNDGGTDFAALTLGPATSVGVGLCKAAGVTGLIVTDGTRVAYASLRCGAFGANGKAPQTPVTAGPLAGYATGAFGLDSDANMAALVAAVAQIRTVLINVGFMA